MSKPMSAEEDYTEYYDERDYWWNLMDKAIPTTPSPTTQQKSYENKEGTDWDYDTYGHGA